MVQLLQLNGSKQVTSLTIWKYTLIRSIIKEKSFIIAHKQLMLEILVDSTETSKLVTSPNRFKKVSYLLRSIIEGEGLIIAHWLLMLEILVDKTETSKLVTSPNRFKKVSYLITINYRKGGPYHSPLFKKRKAIFIESERNSSLLP